MTINNKISEYFQKHSQLLNTKFAIACSGGIDSICLSFAISKICKNFICIICDHGIRDKSFTEAAEVCNYLEQHNINTAVIKTKKIDTTKNLEANARDARYNSLFEFCIANKIHNIFMAHHLDDNIETFLMRLERGTGLKGLVAMPPQSIFRVFFANKHHEITIHRPFLDIAKSNLIEFAKSNNLKHWHDKTNDDTNIKRNFIRKYLTDNIADENFKNNLQITISNLLQESITIDEIVKNEMKKVCKKNEINCLKFQKLPQSIRFKILQEFINKILFEKQILEWQIFKKQSSTTPQNKSINNLIIYDSSPIRAEKILNLDLFLLNSIHKSKHSLKNIEFAIDNNNCNAKFIL